MNEDVKTLAGGGSYEDFNPSDPYNPSNSFKPAFCLNFKTGEAWFGGGKTKINADGSGYLANGKINFTADGRAIGDLFDKQYQIGSINIDLPTVPEGSIKNIILPYYVTRSIPKHNFKVANQSDSIIFKLDGVSRMHTGNLTIEGLIGTGHGYLRMTGYYSGTEDATGNTVTNWIVEDIYFGEVTSYP
jgi:hypothetical protein